MLQCSGHHQIKIRGGCPLRGHCPLHIILNLPFPPTRGPGDFPAILIIENIIEHVAAALSMAPEDVRFKNFRAPEGGNRVPGGGLAAPAR